MSKVTEIKCQDDNVIVQFDDGHRLTFVPYSHGFGYSVEGLRGLRLEKDGEAVCIYYARLHRTGPQPDEHKLALLADGYTQQRVSEYWNEARAETERRFRPGGWMADHRDDHWWYAWMLTREGWIDLDRLENGTAEMVPEEEQE